MSRARIAAIVRQFLENGLKLLLEEPHNVHDLLSVARVEVLELIDFDRLTVVPSTFVQRDYRHVESDVVLRAPLRGPAGGPARRAILIYILIEHLCGPPHKCSYVGNVVMGSQQLPDGQSRHGIASCAT